MLVGVEKDSATVYYISSDGYIIRTLFLKNTVIRFYQIIIFHPLISSITQLLLNKF